MKCLCLPDEKSDTATLVDHVRLFPNRPDVRWKYRAHEQVLGALRQAGIEVLSSDVLVHHVGYQDHALRQRKLERDVRLLQMEDAENPNEPFVLFNLGSIHHHQGKMEEALPLLQRSLKLSQPQDSIVRKLYALLTQCHRQVDHKEEALSVCQAGLGLFPNDTELLFQEGLARHVLKDYEGAVAALQRLLTTEDDPHLASVTVGLRGHLARHNLAVIFQEMGRTAEAEAQWQAALAENPRYTPALLALGEHYLKQGRWPELEQLTQQIAASPAGQIEADLLRARAYLMRKIFDGARYILEEIVRLAPQAIMPRRLLCHLLLQEESDDNAAEKALRDLLELVPDDAEAKNNLAVLLQRRSGQAPVKPSVQPAGTAVSPARNGNADRPTGAELASIIIPCCDQLSYTKLCLESVFRHTRAPYELLLVDNFSRDGTAEYLEEVRQRPGPARVVVIHNGTNQGYAAACNRAIAQAQGRYLVFLNNDTIVTDGWLAYLIKCVLHQWPQVGMVGPVTNFTAAPQKIAVDYTDVAAMPAFAAKRFQEYRGRAAEVERLTGFCLLVRREVIDRIGTFDERYGLGFYEDDDLCLRAKEAGFRLLVALDVFVHHFGNRTFENLGIEPQQQLQRNWRVFFEKWGPAKTTLYRPVPNASTTGPANPQRVSLCMIVKNEEASLAACLKSVADLVHETIVLDTGSTDRTKEIALQCGARVFDFAWVDDFAEARNESIRHATGDWIFWLDADEFLDEDNRRKVRDLFARLKEENVVYVMKQLSTPSHPAGSMMEVDQVRLFPNQPAIRWQYRIHEQILLSVRRVNGEVRKTDVIVSHLGYQDPALKHKKLERNVRLMHRQYEENPDDSITLYHLGWAYLQLGKTAEALPLLRRSLELSNGNFSMEPKIHGLLAQGQRQLGQAQEAFETCRKGRALFPDDVELLFFEALLRHERKDLSGAEACLVRLLQVKPDDNFATLDRGLRSYKARHMLAQIHRSQKRYAEAEVLCRQALSENPEFTPAQEELEDLYLFQGRWQELEQAARRLEGEANGKAKASVLRARGHLARREFTIARQLLEKTIAAVPRAVGPRVILSHVLLQEGRDWDAAERVLRDILALDPGHHSSRNNLAVLLNQRGRGTEPGNGHGM